MTRMIFLLAMLIMSGCAGKEHFGLETRELDIPEYVEAGLHEQEGFKVNSCVFDAIEQSMAIQNVSWWDSQADNCAIREPYRGRVYVKHTEPGSTYFCVEATEYSQKYIDDKWTPLTAKNAIACRNNRSGSKWWISYDQNLLERMALMDIMGSILENNEYLIDGSITTKLMSNGNT